MESLNYQRVVAGFQMWQRVEAFGYPGRLIEL